MLRAVLSGLFRPVVQMPAFWAVVAVSTLFGAVLVGHIAWSTSIRTMNDTARQSASQLMVRLSELYTVLLRPKAGDPADLCDEEHLQDLRRLVFESEYVRDVGVLPDGKAFRCSATVGVLPAPYEGDPPDYVLAPTHRLWVNVPILASENTRAIILQLGRHNALVDMDTLVDVPLVDSYDAAMIFAPPGAPTRILAGSVPDSLAERAAGAARDSADGLVLSRPPWHLAAYRCTYDLPFCAVVSGNLFGVFASQLPTIAGSALTSGLLGALLFAIAARQVRAYAHGSARLRRALRRGELSLVYQPQVDFASGRVVGCEGLLRGPGGAPATTPLSWIESQADSLRIAHFVIGRALSEMAPLLRRREDLTLALNFTAMDIASAALERALEATCRRYGVPPRQITLELVESDRWEDPAVVAALHRLRSCGFNVAMDDFGTGYSNVETLEALFVDVIKIDRSVTAAVGRNSIVGGLLDGLLSLGHRLDKNIVVEGIETEEQAAYCRRRCPSAKAQGWLYGRPVPAVDFVDGLRRCEPAAAPAA